MNEQGILESVRKWVGCMLVGLSREIEVFLGTSRVIQLFEQVNKEFVSQSQA